LQTIITIVYGTNALNEIIETVEIFVKQRHTRRLNSLEAALYPILKKFVFSETGLDHLENTYSELKQKKTYVKVLFYEIWNYIIKDGGIDGQYNENMNKYEYETMDYGSIYLNSLTTFIHNKFAAEIKKESHGRVLIFNIEKLERFEDLYSDGKLDENKVKIEVKLKTEITEYDYDDFLNIY
jgi:hypothetical protein